MTSFAKTPEGRAAAQRMMELYGHTMGPFKPRPGFPGESPAEKKQKLDSYYQRLNAQINPPQPLVAQPQYLGDGLGSMQANSPQLGQMQGILQGTPIGGNPRQIAQLPQQPTGRSGRGTAPATPPSFASQMRGMGLAGMGLQQQFGNKPAGMKKGGAVKKKASSKSYKSGGTVSSASKRGDGCAIKGKTRCKIV
jgi:hypothetical protein